MRSLVQIGRFKRTPIFFHWSVLAIAAAFLIVSVGSIAVGVAAASSYVGVIVLHEIGHAIVARRVRCPVFRIEIYPIHGRCVFEEPFDELDHVKISWGGVIAQMTVAIPLVAFGFVAGVTNIQALNALVAIAGFFSLFMVVLNLIPVFRMDGEMAWRAVPYITANLRAKLKRRKRSRGLRAARRDGVPSV